jgi:hypothetical protein
MSDPVKPIISKPITQTQLDLCRAALNIAAHQCNLTATLVMGRKEQRTAEHFAKAAIAMQNLAQLIDTGHIVGSSIIRATDMQ